MKKQGCVSAIIITYYTGSILWRSIESVLKQECLLEIILINNGNSDEIVEELNKLQNQYSDIIKIISPGNVGFAKACNIGSKYSRGEYIFIINPDCVLISKNAFTEFINFLQFNPDATLLNCKIFNPDHSIQKTCIRNLLDLKILIIEGLYLYKIPYLKRHLPRINLNADSISKPKLVEAISGSLIFMRKTDYENYEGMDEKYFLHIEDLDLCRRINDEGGKIYYLPNIQAVHFLSTSKASKIIVEWHKLKGFLRYFYKFYSIFILGFIAPLLLCRFLTRSTLNITYRLNPLYIYRNLCKFDEDFKNRLLRKNSKILDKKTIILAGSMNQIGVMILNGLINKGHKLKILYKNSSPDLHIKDVEWIQTDFTKSNKIEYLNSSTLIYTAGIWLLPNLLNSISDDNIKRLICFSSTSIFTKSDSTNLDDIKIVKMLKDAERNVISICQKRKINYTILRPTMIYGIGSDKNINFIASFICKYKFFPIFNNAQGLRQPVNVLDLADVAIDIIDKSSSFNKCYNLGGGEIITYLNIIKRIFSIYNIESKILNLSRFTIILKYLEKLFNIPITSDMIMRMNKDMIFDNQKAEIDLGYHPRDFLQ